MHAMSRRQRPAERRRGLGQPVVPPPPEHVRESPLMQAGGYAVFDGLLDAAAMQRLLKEAIHQTRYAEASVVATSDGEEVRGGSPARRFLSAAGSDVQDALYLGARMRDFLADVTGLSARPTSRRGTYTYYVRVGDHLALHRDIESCDLVVISCLHDASEGAERGELRVYPARTDEPLSAIRASPLDGAVPVRLAPGQTLVMFGGIVPHELTPVVAGQRRIVSVLCYRV